MKYLVQNLINAVKSKLSSSAASKRFKVPKRTRHLHRQNALQKIGGRRYGFLNDEQEDFLVCSFKLLAEYGFTITADISLKISDEYFKSIGLSNKPGCKWLRSFVKRHKTEIKWKKEQKLEQIRAKKFTEETRKSWFGLLASTLIELDLMNKPSQIFNCDETGKHIIVTSSTRHVFEKDGDGGKQYTTALIGTSAAGQVISPFIIYAGLHLMNAWCRDGPDGSRYAVTKKVTKYCIWPFSEHAMIDKVVVPAFSSFFTSTIIKKIPPPTNILIPRSSSSVVHSLSTMLSLSESIIKSNFKSITETLHSVSMVLDDTNEKQQQMLFDIQQIKPIQPISLDDHEISSSSDSTYAVLNTVDFNILLFEPQPDLDAKPTTKQINQSLPVQLIEQNKQKQKTKPAVENIHAVGEVLADLLEEQQQYQTTTASTTTSRASRLNNTTGVNITDDDFIKMIQEKSTSKAKQTTSKRKRNQIQILDI
ncbi:unnamed protein product [Rotaria sp. Silwood2]|nr:unnamed protein product [Rotaria sp. Silwood2]CAF4162471.1 unnamed protein product [Rotaria sp. Silwood2]CAF4169935.1 unnamed protein product [Rotaria sp. Silwood2]